MPKHDFLTPKAISNRIKSKGLQKLRWYCQICQKQCRDENGFKCHCQSEAHLRQMRVFSDNPGKFVSGYSREFEGAFISLLRLRGRKRVFANAIYQELIKDKHHIHMKATVWTTLSGFVQYLAKTGRAEIEEAPRGWYITYIDKDPQMLGKQRVAESMEKMELDERERNERRIQKLMENAYRNAREDEVAEKETVLVRSEVEKIHLDWKARKDVIAGKRKPNVFEEDEEVSEVVPDVKKGKREIEEEEDEHAWVEEGLIVKVMNPDVNDGELFRQKGAVLTVKNKYTVMVKMLKMDDVQVEIDQTELETVLPAPGNDVKYVGAGRLHGYTARLEEVKEKQFCAVITILDGKYAGEKVSQVDYQSICKFQKLE